MFICAYKGGGNWHLFWNRVYRQIVPLYIFILMDQHGHLLIFYLEGNLTEANGIYFQLNMLVMI